MSFTVEITQQDARPNGKVRIWFSLTNDTTGKVYPNRGPVSVPANDIPARMQAWADKFENGLAAQELDATLAAVKDGADVDTIPLDKADRVLLRTKALKQAINVMRSAYTGEDRYATTLHTVALIDGYTDMEISALVKLPKQDITDIRIKVTAFNDAVSGLEHGKGELK